MLKDIGWTVTRCIDGGNTTPVAGGPDGDVVRKYTPTTITLTGTDGDNDP